MLKNYLWRRSVRKLVNDMPSLLRTRYGRKSSYTIGQIDRTLETLGQMKNVRYAYAMYLTSEEAIKELNGESNYLMLRERLALAFFDGNIEFDAMKNSRSQIGNHHVGHDGAETD